ncbi:MAG: hypothetical protein GY703_14210 [Gammaproteobacteria bacterium]|nr:hypothetical protein [Gammaproteobacteria bacterium]
MLTDRSIDKEFRALLHSLEAEQMRQVGVRFVKSVVEYCDDRRVTRALEVAVKPEVTEEELEEAHRGVRAATVESRTRCGADCNWDDQAAHFVARATAAVVAPRGQCKAPDPPWQVAISCRMARNCALIAGDDDTMNVENETQYRILHEYLESLG